MPALTIREDESNVSVKRFFIIKLWFEILSVTVFQKKPIFIKLKAILGQSEEEPLYVWCFRK